MREETKNILANKKYQWIALGVIFLLVVVFAVWIRTQNLSLLHDETTGKWLSSDIDPFYWLRIAETMLSGNMPSYDTFRNPALHVAWSTELMPRALVFMYKFAHAIGINAPIELISILSPVIFFIIGIIAYFFLVYFLTKSKGTALVSSILLAFVPIFLYRTTAGVGDHDPLGEATFFIALLAFVGLLTFLNKMDISKKKDLVLALLYSLGTAFLTAFATAGQPGSSNFLYMTIPLSFLVFWVVKSQKIHREEIQRADKKELGLILSAYLIWAIFSELFFMIYGNSLMAGFRLVFSGPYGTINLACLGFMLVDYLVVLFACKNPKIRKFRILFSFGLILVLGILFSVIAGKNLAASSMESLINVINPNALDSNRIGSTVAENQQPFLTDLIAQVGIPFFWISVLGIFLIGIFAAREIRTTKHRIFYALAWIVLTSGIFLTRYSSGSIFKGDNLFSIAVYILGGLIFLGTFALIYFKDEIKSNPSIIIISSWAIFMLISARATQRIYFVIAPFLCFAAAYGVFKMLELARKRKEEISKMISWVLFVLMAAGLIFSLYSFISTSSNQAKYVGPAANSQWQEAMNWTRNNTPADAIFVHWWDYGWWTQTLGERRTVTDGGHANGYWDHLVARYLLTETKPEVSLSFMKSQNVSYLLIDPSDLGKYGAYAKIGSDASGQDRYSSIVTFVSDAKQTKETANGTIKIYQGISAMDSDIQYGDIFLAKENTYLIGIVIEFVGNSLKQPNAVFYNNNQQIKIPIRSVYINGQMMDFGSGINSVLRVMPSISIGSGGANVDEYGALLYLSEKTKDSLFSQLYLMKDINNRYPTIKTEYVAEDPAVKYFNSMGGNLPSIIYYQGFRGPLEIWKVNYPANILSHSEFTLPSGEYAGLDNLQFVK